MFFISSQQPGTPWQHYSTGLQFTEVNTLQEGLTNYFAVADLVGRCSPAQGRAWPTGHHEFWVRGDAGRVPSAPSPAPPTLLAEQRGSSMDPASSSLCPAPGQHPVTGVSASPRLSWEESSRLAGAAAQPQPSRRHRWVLHICPEMQFCLQVFKQDTASTAERGQNHGVTELGRDL